VADEAATVSLAARLARLCSAGDVVTLTGDLGSGKTAFARGFIRAIAGAEVEVASPTFMLVQQYDVRGSDGNPCLLWHYDLYRLKHAEELQELALDDAFSQGISLIEWPEIIANLLPSQHIAVTITHGVHASERHIAIHSSNPLTL
jgi:tRNA threonylcarbamoyladenosine biosynthesis protein TsaE